MPHLPPAAALALKHARVMGRVWAQVPHRQPSEMARESVVYGLDHGLAPGDIHLVEAGFDDAFAAGITDWRVMKLEHVLRKPNADAGLGHVGLLVRGGYLTGQNLPVLTIARTVQRVADFPMPGGANHG